jgi:hypothetical protein
MVVLSLTMPITDASQPQITRTLIAQGPSAERPTIPPALRVSGIHLEPPSISEREPASVLRFKLENDGIVQVTDVILTIAVFEKQAQPTAAPKMIVRPFNLRTATTVEPGYSVEYEMLFRNLSNDCNCAPHVEVLSARAVR